MEIDLWLKAVLVMILLLLSAFFSSIESAYFSLSRSVLDRMRDSSDPRANRVARLMEDPRRLLATILSGNTIVNTAAAAITALIAVDLAVQYHFSVSIAVMIEVAAMSLIILFLAELIPKFLALRDPEAWAIQSSSALKLMALGLWVISTPLSWITGLFSELTGVKEYSATAMSESEIRALVQVGHEHGALEIEERKMIHSIFQFADTAVREAMVPRIDIVAVDVNVPLDDLLDMVVARGHSRIPVYEGTIDNIIGLIYAKDLLSITRKNAEFNLKSILRTNTLFVPEEKKLDDLLAEFQTQKIHMALVVDEYGGTAGLITMEDIIEEIVGEIQDEYDKEQPMINRLDETTMLVNGLYGVADLNSDQGIEFIPESEAYDTLAGFVYRQLGVVPKKGQEFDHKGYRFIVEEILGKRIIKVKIIKETGVFEGA